MRWFLFCLAGLVFAQTPDELIDNGRYSRAWPLVEERVKANPEDPHAQYLLGKLKFVSGDYQAAIKPLEAAVAGDAGNAEYHALLGQASGRYAQQAPVLKKFGLARRCKAEIERAIQLDPSHLEANATLIMYLDQAPGMIGGDKERAKTIPDLVAKVAPAKAWLVRAYVAAETNQSDKAQEYYRKALAADPENFNARVRFAGILIDAQPRKLEEAEKQAKAAKDAKARAHYAAQLVAIYARSARYAEMENELKEAERVVPDDLTPYWSAGRVLSEAGRELQRVEGYVKKYLSQRPEIGAPSHANAYWILGQLYEKLGRKADAVAQLEKSVSLEPDFEPAQKDLKRLRS